RNRDSATADDPGLWTQPGDNDPCPWPTRMEPTEPHDGGACTPETGPEDAPDRSRPWYLVILGALPAREAFARLDAAFADDADEDESNRRTQGNVIAACAVLDE